ncbi:MAG: hypothetical protein RL376_1267, partial [Verrucomicrobiota bacterium]
MTSVSELRDLCVPNFRTSDLPANMTIEQLQAAAANNLWVNIQPEISMGVLALLLLVLEIFLPKKKALIPTISIVAQLGLLIGLLANFTPTYLGTTSFSGLLYHSSDGQYLRA